MTAGFDPALCLVPGTGRNRLVGSDPGRREIECSDLPWAGGGTVGSQTRARGADLLHMATRLTTQPPSTRHIAHRSRGFADYLKETRRFGPAFSSELRVFQRTLPALERERRPGSFGLHRIGRSLPARRNDNSFSWTNSVPSMSINPQTRRRLRKITNRARAIARSVEGVELVPYRPAVACASRDSQVDEGLRTNGRARRPELQSGEWPVGRHSDASLDPPILDRE